jgi:thioredoxin reductase
VSRIWDPAAPVDVLIVGGGPAGLAAATELRRLGVGKVLVTDREAELGGIPRHSWHTGYGIRDLHRCMTGPAYARRLVESVRKAGAELRAATTVTSLEPASASGHLPSAEHLASAEHVPMGERVTLGEHMPSSEHLRASEHAPLDGHVAELTSARGRERVLARAVLIATGCRERPRSARLIPGDRPTGVMTTGELQQRVYLNGERLPGRAVVVGAEHVGFSAAVTLAHAGAEVVALVTEQPRHQSYAAFRIGAAIRWHLPVWTSAVVSRITGRGKLDGVEITDTRSGVARFVECGTLVFTADWIPDHELARAAGLDIDPGTRGPAVDTTLRTSAPGIFAAGNVIHAAETADIAALSGRHAATHIAAYLADQASSSPASSAATAHAATRPAHTRPIATTDTRSVQADEPTDITGPAETRPAGTDATLAIHTEAPLSWISPNLIRLPVTSTTTPSGTDSALDTAPPSPPDIAPPLGRFTLRSNEFRTPARLEVRQDGRRLAVSRPMRLIPGRPVHLHARWLANADPTGGPIRVSVAASRSRTGA